MRDAAVSKVREAMAERDVERLVVMDADNLAYLTGIQDPSGMSGVLVLEQDDVTLLVSKFYRYSLDGLPGTQLYTSREDRADRIEALELDGAVADEPGRLDADLEGTDLVAECRATKLPFEIDAMREACDTGSKAFQELLKRFDTGMQEWGLVREADAAFVNLEVQVHAY
ncbi:MAG: aminopeptidase P family N-terminal domain-containing protein, partial [Candidatus Nanohaloarchaea archaeon]|nr:aminopeptidase P family N-terminal domain-containing protein [Candidatus Nanohaloarchaea archaeon]